MRKSLIALTVSDASAQEHVLLTRSNTVLLDGFGPLCRLERTVDDSTLPSWALQEDTPPEHDLDTDSNISDDPTWNAQHEHRVTVEDDGVLDQVTSAQVRGYLRASTTDGDVFAFGFLIVEVHLSTSECAQPPSDNT